MNTQTATASQNTATDAKVAHLGCPWCWNTASRIGDAVITLCGELTAIGAGPTFTEKPAECPLCHDVARGVIADGACRRCP